MAKSNGSQASWIVRTLMLTFFVAVAGCSAVQDAGEEEEALPFESHVVSTGPACGNTTCGFGQKCVVDCCRPVGTCAWAASTCPDGMYPYPPSTFLCPGVPGLPANVLCLDVPPGQPICANPRARHCATVPAGQCSGPSAPCAACGTSCYGRPAALDPDAVACVWR